MAVDKGGIEEENRRSDGHIASTFSGYTMNIKWGQVIKPQGQAPRVPFFNS